MKYYPLKNPIWNPGIRLHIAAKEIILTFETSRLLSRLQTSLRNDNKFANIHFLISFKKTQNIQSLEWHFHINKLELLMVTLPQNSWNKAMEKQKKSDTLWWAGILRDVVGGEGASHCGRGGGNAPSPAMSTMRVGEDVEITNTPVMTLSLKPFIDKKTATT